VLYNENKIDSRCHYLIGDMTKFFFLGSFPCQCLHPPELTSHVNIECRSASNFPERPFGQINAIFIIRGSKVLLSRSRCTYKKNIKIKTNQGGEFNF
jgi:hypothetical protein